MVMVTVVVLCLAQAELTSVIVLIEVKINFSSFVVSLLVSRCIIGLHVISHRVYVCVSSLYKHLMLCALFHVSLPRNF